MREEKHRVAVSRLARATPQLPVENVEETQRYYRDVLGFHIDWTWGENDYGSVSCDETILFLCSAKPPLSPNCLFIHVSEVDALYAELKANGAKMISEPEDKPWGMREFTVEDNNGHCLRMAQGSKVSRHKPREKTSGVQYVHRRPTGEEHRELIEAVGWTSFTNFAARERSLPQSLFCVVAEVEGKIAGMARVIGDGAQFFYVMDVAVTPEMQGRGIGTGLMNEVVDYIQKNAPEKALVGLFTGAGLGGFYERFGFAGPETGLYGMAARSLKKA